ncbi:MAG: peptidyl-prolyl cis-trans isomerase, partial [Candidatus Sumerlaeota bacterium]|nr:peptidyl-prolyl cis-trans isomerase [Candidatus Sumerlaeota bacterium]
LRSPCAKGQAIPMRSPSRLTSRGLVRPCAILAFVATSAARFAAAQVATTDTLLAQWPGGEVRLSDVQRVRALPLLALDGTPTTGTLTARQWIERAMLYKRLLRLAEERSYANHPDFLALQEHLLDQKRYDDAYAAEILSIPRPTPEEVAGAYRQRRNSYGSPERVFFRYVYFDTSDLSPRDIEAKRKKAERALEEARKPKADFAALAERYSDLDVESKGRVFGPVARGALWPEAEDALFALRPGGVTPLIETPTGLHILQLASRRPERQPPAFEEIADKLADQLLLERQAARRQALLAELRRQYPVSIDENLKKGPLKALLSNQNDPAIQVGPWSISHERLLDEAIDEQVSPLDREAFSDFLSRQIDQRLLILRGRDLDERLGAANELSAAPRDLLLCFFALDQLARETAAVSEQELDTFYLQNLSRFERPDSLRVRNIEVYLAAPRRRTATSDMAATDTLRDFARRLSDAISNGEEPKQAAKQFEKNGLDVRVRPESTVSLRGLPQAYRSKVESLTNGQASPPIPWPRGWLIVQLVSRSSGGYIRLQEARPIVRKILERQKMLEARGQVIKRLLGRTTYLDSAGAVVSSLSQDKVAAP